MPRTADLLTGILAAGSLAIVIAGVWPASRADLADQPVLQGQPVTGPVAGDWIPALSGRIARAERPVRTVTQDRDPLAGFELIGLVETGDAQWALMAGNGESHTLEVGDWLNGYELVQILADRVVFALDGDQRSFELNR
ncbi:hypothetical protein [Maricaulis parjimensis]|uniref:hypothetical protein n=1 Tax=Maricaulis parjimensis TaxID=144023 RepID=UPI0019396ACC|nr:hypothetical protein [Maricaulis parjimensis]